MVEVGIAAHPWRRLGPWRTAFEKEKHASAARTEAWITGWSWLLLLLTMLYVMIGNTPYEHEPVFDPRTGGPVMSPVNRYIWLALAAMAIPVLWARRGELLQALQAFWPLALLFAWFACTSLWALDRDASNRRLFLYAVDAVICLAVAMGLKDARRMHGALATACAIVIGIDLASWIIAPKLSQTEIGLAAIHSHKNTLGAVMLLCGLIIWPYVAAQRTWGGRAFWIGTGVGGFALLVASLSKTSLAILVVTGLAAPFLLRVVKSRGEVLSGLLLAGLALAAGGFLAWLAFSFATGADPLGPIRKLTFTQRTDVWTFALEQFSHHPWRGLGFGSFWDVDPRVQPSLKTDYWFAQPDAPTNESHNGYIDLLVTTGITGLIMALIVLFRWMGRGLWLVREAMRTPTGEARRALPYLTYLALFPLVFFAHNWMESTYFNANSLFGLISLLVGFDIDMRFAALRWPSAS